MRFMNCFVYMALLSGGTVGCSAPSSADPAELAKRKIKVVTTVGMITDAVQNVGGNRVEVAGLMGPGVDPHLYKATEGDIGRMVSADLILYGGLHLEGQMADVFEKMRGRVKTVAVSEALDPNKDLRPATEGFEGSHDPHVWFDVQLWMKVVGLIRDVLCEMDPAHQSLYQANSERYLQELRELDQYVKDQASRVPASQRVLITAHDAFYYFGKAYGFEVRGLQGVSTASQTGVKDVQSLAEFIAERQIPAIFVESSVSPQTIEAVQAAVKAKGFSVRIGGELFSDAMGSAGTPEGTYIGMVRHNIDTIVRSLLAS